MSEYLQSKIYKIEKDDMCYYGSTKMILVERMYRHRSGYRIWKKTGKKYTSSFGIFDKFGVNNCDIILVENFPCNSKFELKEREAYYIRSFECVNKMIPNRTNKQYIQENKETWDEYHKNYRSTNKQSINEKQSVKHDCLCGGKFRSGDKSKHFKTLIHVTYMNTTKD